MLRTSEVTTDLLREYKQGSDINPCNFEEKRHKTWGFLYRL